MSGAADRPSRSIRLVFLYYVGTVGFILLDLVGGWNVRVTGLQSVPLAKYSYYAGCLGAGYLVHRVPGSAPFVALSESTINLVILLIGFMGGYLTALEGAVVGVIPTVVVSYGQIINLLLNGGILITGIYATLYLRRELTG